MRAARRPRTQRVSARGADVPRDRARPGVAAAWAAGRSAGLVRFGSSVDRPSLTWPSQSGVRGRWPARVLRGWRGRLLDVFYPKQRTAEDILLLRPPLAPVAVDECFQRLPVRLRIVALVDGVHLLRRDRDRDQTIGEHGLPNRGRDPWVCSVR